MNGLELIDEKAPNLTDKFLRQEPKENAFIEINNVIASSPLEQVSRHDIERILVKHEISEKQGKPRLLQIYSRVLRHYAKDFQISDQEAASLMHLQEILFLTGHETGNVHAQVLYPIFQNAIKNAIFDGRLTSEEERWLNIVAQKLRIPDNFIAQLYGTVVQPFIQSKLETMVGDNRFSPEEERELLETGKSLKASINFPEPVRAILVRARFLWEVANGTLPRLEVPIYLHKDEFCAAFVSASLEEVREESTAISEYSERVNYFHDWRDREVTSGKIKTENKIQHRWTTIDTGTLFFTNQRLLFNGNRGNYEDALREIIGAKFDYSVLRIERSTGLDRVFVFDYDIETLQTIFERLMKDARC